MSQLVADYTDISRARAWWLAARPKTLAAAVVPVLVGTAVAFAQEAFSPLAALAALVGAMLLQIGTNFANDYFDFRKGADTEERLGPLRVVQAGLLDEAAVRRAMILTFGAAAAVGAYLIALGGWPIAIIGVLSILSGIAYTGGPYPLGYHGLGDLFVFIFFGVVAVTGTHYVQAGVFSWEAVVASIPIGLLSVAILVVNNYRDVETDRRAGKNTLAVRLGEKLTRAQYVVLVGAAFLVPVLQWALGEAGAAVLLPLACLPLAITTTRNFLTRRGAQLNPVLAATARLLAVFGVLYAAALAFGSQIPGSLLF